jgi:VCBS repeat-containing protein
VSATRASGEAVSSYTTTATASGDLSNYDVTYVAGSFSITKAPATVTAGSGTKVSGTPDPVPAVTASETGFLAADNITVSATRASGEARGSYATTATASGAALGNYDVTYVPGIFTITNAAPVAVNDSATTNEDTPVSGSVSGNDSDVDGDTLTASLVSGPSHGTLVLNPNGSFSYTPAANYNGPDSFTYRQNDGQADSNVATVSLTVVPVNDAPVCTTAKPSLSILWPPNHKMVGIKILGLTDVEGDPLTVKITRIFQDEPVNSYGDGNTGPDATGIGTDTAWVRAERSGGYKGRGNGRVYHISFTVTDSSGLSCSGEVTVGVPHDMGGHATPIDDGPIYDSTKPGPRGHYDGDRCDHDRGAKGHREGDDCEHDQQSHSGHYDGDGCDRNDHRDRRPGDKKDDDKERGKKGGR